MSVFQTNDTKELKTQGAECQGPDKTLCHEHELLRQFTIFSCTVAAALAKQIEIDLSPSLS